MYNKIIQDEAIITESKFNEYLKQLALSLKAGSAFPVIGEMINYFGDQVEQGAVSSQDFLNIISTINKNTVLPLALRQELIDKIADKYFQLPWPQALGRWQSLAQSDKPYGIQIIEERVVKAISEKIAMDNSLSQQSLVDFGELLRTVNGQPSLTEKAKETIFKALIGRYFSMDWTEAINRLQELQVDKYLQSEELRQTVVSLGVQFLALALLNDEKYLQINEKTNLIELAKDLSQDIWLAKTSKNILLRALLRPILKQFNDPALSKTEARKNYNKILPLLVRDFSVDDYLACSAEILVSKSLPAGGKGEDIKELLQQDLYRYMQVNLPEQYSKFQSQEEYFDILGQFLRFKDDPLALIGKNMGITPSSTFMHRAYDLHSGDYLKVMDDIVVCMASKIFEFYNVGWQEALAQLMQLATTPVLVMAEWKEKLFPPTIQFIAKKIGSGDAGINFLEVDEYIHVILEINDYNWLSLNSKTLLMKAIALDLYNKRESFFKGAQPEELNEDYQDIQETFRSKNFHNSEVNQLILACYGRRNGGNGYGIMNNMSTHYYSH